MTIGRQIERILVVFAGTLAIYLGFRLFYLVKQKQGELRLQGKDLGLSLGDVGPGIYFALFGSLILVTNLFRQVEKGVVEQVPSVTGDGTKTVWTFGRGFLNMGGNASSTSESSTPYGFRVYRDPKMQRVVDILMSREIAIKQSIENGTANQLWVTNAVKFVRAELQPFVTSPHYLKILEDCNTPEEVWIFLESYIPYFYLKETKPQ